MTVGREDFDAIDKAQALMIAAAIFYACSDIAFGYELWSGDERIPSPKETAASDIRGHLSDYQQQVVIDRAIALRDSHWLVAGSKKLIHEIETLVGSSTLEASKTHGRQATPSDSPLYAHRPALAADPANPFESFLAGIESPALRALATHWRDVRGDKSMPSWDDLSSSALAPHFQLLWGYQFDRQRGDFIGRLAGRHIRDWLGPKFCGAKLEDIHPPQVLEETRAFLAKVVATPGIGRCSGRLFTIGGHTVTGVRIALPLATDGFSADGILGASDYIYPPVTGPVALILENIEWCAISGSGGPRS